MFTGFLERFRGALVDWQGAREERLSGAFFFMGIIMDEVRDEALNSVFKALLWGGSLLPLFYA